MSVPFLAHKYTREVLPYAVLVLIVFSRHPYHSLPEAVYESRLTFGFTPYIHPFESSQCGVVMNKTKPTEYMEILISYGRTLCTL